MDASFWYQRWETNRIGFHQNKPNPALVSHVERLSLARGERVFLPLCGKTLDIGWLLSMGYKVAGAELSKLAVEQLFAELNVEPEIEPVGELLHYCVSDLDIFVGDIFNLTSDLLGTVNAVYDRAALVALPEEMRKQYSAHLASITHNASQLVITFEYNQELMEGPPFSVPTQEVIHHYESVYDVTCVDRNEVRGGLKGFCPAEELVWLLSEKQRIK